MQLRQVQRRLEIILSQMYEILGLRRYTVSRREIVDSEGLGRIDGDGPRSASYRCQTKERAV